MRDYDDEYDDYEEPQWTKADWAAFYGVDEDEADRAAENQD